MAERRCFNKKITESDAFLEMPMSTQCLYFHLNMEADDDGFVNAPKKIMRMVGCSEDDMKLLIMKNFLITFDSGVIVIKHWRMHNTLQNDRYKKTDYQEEFAMLSLKPNRSYTIGNDLDTNCIQSVSKVDTQHNITKHNITEPKEINNKSIKHRYGEYKNVLLTDEQMQKLVTEFPMDFGERIERVSSYCQSTGKTYKDYLATIRNWARKEKPKEEDSLPKYKGVFDEFD